MGEAAVMTASTVSIVPSFDFDLGETADLLRDSVPGRKIKTLAVRARAPLFDTAPFDVIGRPTADGNGAELWTVTPKGTIAAQATATLA